MTRWMPSIAILISFAAAQDDSQEPLCRAARDGDLALVRTLLARGANSNVRDEHGETPLMHAASGHHRSFPDAYKRIAPDYPGTAQLLIDNGADVNARDLTGRKALVMAV